MTDSLKTVARWETRGGKHWYELQIDKHGIYSIKGDGSGGVIGSVTEVQAFRNVEGRVAMARELDGINMKRTA